MSFTARLLGKLQPWLTPDLERWLKALGAPFEQVAEITEEVGTYGEPGWVPGYGKLLNPVEAPAEYLPWLGQFVGVEVKKTATETEARAEVKAESGLARGTRGSLEVLLKKALGATAFLILEREPTPYRLQILVPAGHLSNSVYEEINLTIPGGLLYEVLEVAGAWAAGGKKWSEIGAGKKWSEMTEGNY
jgi:hypothetical protein